jgi:hypothetical protein
MSIYAYMFFVRIRKKEIEGSFSFFGGLLSEWLPFLRRKIAFPRVKDYPLMVIDGVVLTVGDVVARLERGIDVEKIGLWMERLRREFPRFPPEDELWKLTLARYEQLLREEEARKPPQEKRLAYGFLSAEEFFPDEALTLPQVVEEIRNRTRIGLFFVGLYMRGLRKIIID